MPTCQPYCFCADCVDTWERELLEDVTRIHEMNRERQQVSYEQMWVELPTTEEK
jgi:hypothetical protein